LKTPEQAESLKEKTEFQVTIIDECLFELGSWPPLW